MSGRGDFYPYLRLIVDLIEKSRLPAIYPWRDAVELAGLMAHESDVGELLATHGR